MKTKAYKLAAELGLQEHSVLEWLKQHGYPNARRADTIRADVAQAARQALGRRSGGRPTGRQTQSRQTQSRQPQSRQTQSRREAPTPAGRNSQGFRVSFADLLESHLPQDGSAGSAPNRPPPRPAPRPSAPQGRPSSGADQTVRLQLRRVESERDRAQRELVILRQSLESENRRLAEARAALTELQGVQQRATDAKVEIDRLLLERATLKQSLQAAADEQATLAQTCVDLQGEVSTLRQSLATADAEQEAKQAVITDLEQAMQREMAWRTRALELERAANLGNNLAGLLQEFGLDDMAQQASMLRALLERPESAGALIRSIRQVDAPTIQRLVQGRLARICGHPQCQQIATSDDRITVRVSPPACEVCGGRDEQRWFARLVNECGRAGVRRLLVVGGGAQTQASLRTLSQGRPVDLRLISADEDVSPARVRGRVEGCDVLVTWSAQVVPAPISGAYALAAQAEGRLVVSVLGEASGVTRFARAVCNRLARSLILAAI